MTLTGRIALSGRDHHQAFDVVRQRHIDDIPVPWMLLVIASSILLFHEWDVFMGGGVEDHIGLPAIKEYHQTVMIANTAIRVQFPDSEVSL